INRKFGNLPGQNGANRKCDDQCCKDDGQNGKDTTQTPAPKHKNWWRQDKAHQNRNRDWNEYFASEIKCRHHERDQKKSGQHFECDRLIGLLPGTSRRTSEKIAHTLTPRYDSIHAAAALLLAALWLRAIDAEGFSVER